MANLPTPPLSDADFSAWQHRRAEKTVRAGAVLNLPAVAPITPEEMADREARWALELEKTRSSAARDWFSGKCPPELHPEKTNWAHPDLAPFLPQIGRARAWSPESEGGRGLLLAGPTGRGKSRAFWALIHHLRCETPRHEVQVWHAHDFFSELQAQVRFGNDDAKAFVLTAARAPLLFIDDLGQQAKLQARADWAEAWFFRLLDLRAGANLPLFVTTNLDAYALAGVPRPQKGTGQQLKFSNDAAVRADPLMRRLLAVCAPVRF